MYVRVSQNEQELRVHCEKNEVWATRKVGENYAKRNKYKKSVKWIVLWYDKKYRIYENKTNQTSVSS